MSAQNLSNQQSGFNVFFRSEACQIYSLAVEFGGGREPVALFNFFNLKQLQEQYPDMVLIHEDEANRRIADMKAMQQQTEQARIENASQKTDLGPGQLFIHIDAGRS